MVSQRTAEDAAQPKRRGRRRAVALLVEASNAFSRELLRGVCDWKRAREGWAIHLSELGRGSEPPPGALELVACAESFAAPQQRLLRSKTGNAT